MGELRITDHTGDTVLTWEKGATEEARQSQATVDTEFRRLAEGGYLTYAVDEKNAGKGEVIRDFDPEAHELIVATPQLQGG